jgi:hypothetical protein
VNAKPPILPSPQCWMGGREGYQINSIEKNFSGSVNYTSLANVGVPCCPHFWVTCAASQCVVLPHPCSCAGVCAHVPVLARARARVCVCVCVSMEEEDEEEVVAVVVVVVVVVVVAVVVVVVVRRRVPMDEEKVSIDGGL